MHDKFARFGRRTLTSLLIALSAGCIAPAYLQSSAERRMCDCSAVATIEFEDAQSFPYLASEAKRSRVLAGYSILKPGTPLNECVALLGPPDRCSGRGPKLGRCKGVALGYDLYHKERELVIEGSDIRATFELDLNWRFVGAYPAEPDVRAALSQRMNTPAVTTSAADPAPAERP